MSKVSNKQQEKIEKAAKDFEKVKMEIEPFIRTKKIVAPSTAGKWQIEVPVNYQESSEVRAQSLPISSYTVG